MTSKNLFSEEKNKDGYTASYVMYGILGGHWAGDVMSVWTQDIFDGIVLMLNKPELATMRPACVSAYIDHVTHMD